MAQFVEVPNTVLLEMRYTYQGIPAENTLWFTRDAGVNTTNMSILASTAVGKWETYIAPVSVNSLVLREAYVTDQGDQNGPVVSLTDDLPVTGVLLEPGAPSNVALSIKFTTEKRGRSFRGKNFALGFARGAVVNNLLTQSVADAWVNFYMALQADALLTGYKHVVASRYTAGAPRPVGLATPVTNVSYTDLRVDTMRGRLS